MYFTCFGSVTLDIIKIYLQPLHLKAKVLKITGYINKNNFIQGFPKIHHSGIDARTALEQNKIYLGKC